MPITGQIGRKSWEIRLMFITMYTFLVIGAATMVYPFLLMISGSTKSAVDIKYFNAIPRFLKSWSDEGEIWLWRKHIEGLFNELASDMQQGYQVDAVSFEQVSVPSPSAARWEQIQAQLEARRRQEYERALGRDLDEETAKRVADQNLPETLTGFGPPTNPELAVAFDEWLREGIDTGVVPDYGFTAGYLLCETSRTVPLNNRRFREYLRENVGEEIGQVNAALDTNFISWTLFNIREESYLERRDQPQNSPFMRTLIDFRSTEVAPGLLYLFSVDGAYHKGYLRPTYGADIAAYNKTHDTDYASYDQVPLPRTYPADAPAKVREDWEYYLRNFVMMQWVRVEDSPAARAQYHAFLEAKYGTLRALNQYYQEFHGREFAAWDEVPLVDEPPIEGIVRSDWEAYVVGWDAPDGRHFAAPVETLRLHSLDFLWRDHLLATYGSLAGINEAFGTDYQDILHVQMPQRDLHYQWYQQNRGFLRYEFVTRNYKTVAEYILFHGRGVFNTVVYCLLAVCSALLVNPLAAYAMSRYKLPSSYKILLFLMCTMAFPPMVTAIPSFLMLRTFNLLNTFAALILPGLANGYAVFLLKGFFDSQPQELYESAQLDGASEWVMFWQITMSLSKPILAVIALQAFQMAYSNFMFAFVVCQDEKMWTLMVWLYQLQQRSGQAVMYASLIIAAIPTFLIFLFCQNMIMRGIVVPSEK